MVFELKKFCYSNAFLNIERCCFLWRPFMFTELIVTSMELSVHCNGLSFPDKGGHLRMTIENGCI